MVQFKFVCSHLRFWNQKVNNKLFDSKEFWWKNQTTEQNGIPVITDWSLSNKIGKLWNQFLRPVSVFQGIIIIRKNETISLFFVRYKRRSANGVYLLLKYFKEIKEKRSWSDFISISVCSQEGASWTTTHPAN